MRTTYPSYPRGRGRGQGLGAAHSFDPARGRGGSNFRGRGRGGNGHLITPRLQNTGSWMSYPEIRIRVRGLPTTIDTLSLWELFDVNIAPDEPIKRIDLTEARDGIAYITYSPPPKRQFWLKNNGKLPAFEFDQQPWRPWMELLAAPQHQFRYRSPIESKREVYYDMITRVQASAMSFGAEIKENTCMTMKGVDLSMKRFEDSMNEPVDLRNEEIILSVNLPMRSLEITFFVKVRRFFKDPVSSESSSSSSSSESSERYTRVLEKQKALIKFHQLKEIYKTIKSDDVIKLTIPMKTPPVYFHQMHNKDDIRKTHDNGRHWDERQTWSRSTSIADDHTGSGKRPLSFRKTDAIFDIGRWKVISLRFQNSLPNRQKIDQLVEALGDYNVETKEHSYNFAPRSRFSVWDQIDPPINPRIGPGAYLEEMSSNVVHLTWPLRYQLEACISHDVLHEQNISRDFIDQLYKFDQDPTLRRQALRRLEYVLDKKLQLDDPIELLGNYQEILTHLATTEPKLPPNCVKLRHVHVTPTTMYLHTPNTEMSNRILRKYQLYQDRFLRVKFSDEKHEGRLRTSFKESSIPLFTRVYLCCKRGIKIGDRHFEYLGASNSQFRENGAYFFASTATVSAASIRASMGNFQGIQTVPKFASRMGQCFSTTRAIKGVQTVKLEKLEDIERNGCCFTDGVGRISPFLASVIASELGLVTTNRDPPSLYQFRLAGAKGVLAIDPSVKDPITIQLRSSQVKFQAINEGIEIVRYSNFASAFLNRQLILVLNSRGVKNEIFDRKFDEMLDKLDQAMVNEEQAITQLCRNVDFNHSTLAIAKIMTDGFMKARDPFALSLMQLWSTWTRREMRDRARIVIEDGAFLLGCVDEIGVLRGHFEQDVSDRDNDEDDPYHNLPEIFLQIDPNDTGEYKVIEGICVVARNPSLHPGDVRVVRAVDAPALYHLKNVVVFPQSGDRDLPNMCSGGDLDGDDYIVMWDKEMIPTEIDYEPMDFTPIKPKREVGPINIDKVIKFQAQYMENSSVGLIATHHLANADFASDGVKSPKCLELAKLHSLAVDYVKTGNEAKLTWELKVKKWPHFMPSPHRSQDLYYKSTRILGKLYDKIPHPEFWPLIEEPFDQRVLTAYQMSEQHLIQATQLKLEYDIAMRRIMTQYEVKTEFEIWTGFALDFVAGQTRYKFHEVLSDAMHTLRDRFLEECQTAAGGSNPENLDPFVAAMYTVTSKDVEFCLAELKSQGREIRDLTPEERPLISFPWLYPEILGKIATGRRAAFGPSITLLRSEKSKTSAKHHTNVLDDESVVPNIVTSDGVTHAGEVLSLGFVEQTPGAAPKTPLSDSVKSILDELNGLQLHQNETSAPESPSKLNSKFSPKLHATAMAPLVPELPKRSPIAYIDSAESKIQHIDQGPKKENVPPASNIVTNQDIEDISAVDLSENLLKVDSDEEEEEEEVVILDAAHESALARLQRVTGYTDEN